MILVGGMSITPSPLPRQTLYRGWLANPHAHDPLRTADRAAGSPSIERTASRADVLALRSARAARVGVPDVERLRHSVATRGPSGLN